MAERKKHKGVPAPRWNVQPLRKIEGHVGLTCPDERCGEHGKPIQPVEDGDVLRCPTCRTTVTRLEQP